MKGTAIPGVSPAIALTHRPRHRACLFTPHQVVDEQRVRLSGHERGTGIFTFERVYGPDASQATVFDDIARPQLEVGWVGLGWVGLGWVGLPRHTQPSGSLAHCHPHNGPVMACRARSTTAATRCCVCTACPTRARRTQCSAQTRCGASRVV
jgi:hypothetical protein